MSTSGGKIKGPGGGEKKGDAGPCIVMATETHSSHGHGHSLPMDLAGHRSANIVTVAANPHHQPGLVQLRPVRTFTSGGVGGVGGAGAGGSGGMGISPGSAAGALMSGKIMGVGGLGSYGHVVVSSTGVGGLTPTSSQTSSIISVNRSGQNIILPGRLGQTPLASVSGSSPGVSTLQFARGTIVGNVRPVSNPPGAITVTPMSTPFATSIRLAGPVNNGSWIQTSNSPQGTFNSMIRPTTIQMNRTVRPLQVDAKMVHLPAQGSVQHHVTQIQMLDNKGSIIKPSLSATPIVRGTLHPTGTNPTGTPLTIPFTLRASIPTLHRPPTSSSPATSQVQKVITQPGHGQPIQLVTAPKISQLQAITPIPRLNPVCLTISSPANQTANNTTPVVAMAPRSSFSGANLIMTPSMVTTTQGTPISKIFPLTREMGNPMMDLQGIPLAVSTTTNAISTSGVTFTLSGGGVGSLPAGHLLKTLPSGTTTMQIQGTSGNHLVQVQGPVGVQSVTGPTVLTTINPTSGGLPQNPQIISTNAGVTGNTSFFVEHKGLNVSVLHPNSSAHTMAGLEKRHLAGVTSFNPGGDNKGTLMGLGTSAMILTSTSTPQQSQQPVSTLSTHSFAHPVSIGSGASGTTFNHHLTSSNPSLNPQQVSIFATTPVSSKQIISSGTHPVTITMSGGGLGPTTYNAHLGPSLVGPNAGLHSALPAHMLPSSTKPLGPVPLPSSNSTTGVLPGPVITNSNGPIGGVSAASTSTATSVTTTAPTGTTIPPTTSTTAVTTSVSTPAQSPSQAQSQATKSTLSPRPSILRKREAASDLHNVPLRAQRNLALNFGGSSSSLGNSLSSTAGGGTSVVGSTASASISASAAVAAATANKENNLSSSSCGTMGLGPLGSSTTNYSSTLGNLSILKKEFQPPNEESSWQSCSSNSSSGSTTLSTTSETAEIQLQQLQMQQQSMAELNIHGLSSSSSVGISLSFPTSSSSTLSSRIGGNPFEGGTTPSSSSAQTQNGVVRIGSSAASTGGSRVRTVSSSKAQSRDIERLKGKTKDDSVSPRKKPRKQQLTTSDLFESASPEISFYQGKKLKKNELMDSKLFEGFAEKLKDSLPDPAALGHVAYIVKRPHISLIGSNKFEMRPNVNHFHRYSDVKAKEERRPNINDLANQRNVQQRVAGWKLMRLTSQVDQIVGLEMNVVSNFNNLLAQMDTKVGPNCATRDLNRIQELLKGNIQRCKVIRDQMSDSRSQVTKIVEHKARVQTVINKFANKRHGKKRERERERL